MNFKNAKRNPKTFKSLSGMSLEIFQHLAIKFSVVCQDYYSKYNFKGQLRKRLKSFRKDSRFSSYDEMLFFVLFYLKTNPLQETLAAMYKMSQGDVNRYIHRLLELLKKTLSDSGSLPSRDKTEIWRIAKAAKTLYLDGTERPVQRSVDYDIQKAHFGGKKNDIRLKTT